jgi:hypothetical protein
MEFANSAEAEQSNLRSGETILHLDSLPFAERRFDAVFVRCAQFDGFEPGHLTVFDDRRDVPVFGQIVSHQAELESSAAERGIITLDSRCRSWLDGVNQSP